MEEAELDAIDEMLTSILMGDQVADTCESVNVEFKTDGRSLQDDLANLAEAASCFANTQGGTLIIGVQNKVSGPEAIKGTRMDPDKLRHRIYQLTNPPLLVEAESRECNGKSLIILGIPSGTQVHSANGKMPSERIEQHCVPMSTERVRAVVSQKIGFDWSGDNSGISVSEVSAAAIEIARGMLRKSVSPTRQRLADASSIDLLRALGVITSDQNLTNGGALLFVENASTGTIVSYTHRKTPAGQLTANENLLDPLLIAITRLFDLVNVRLETTPVSIGNGQQLHIADLPEPAVREAIINGLMHRDYYSRDRTVVEHTATQLRVSSPGGFLPGISVDNVLTTSSRTRNTNLSNAMRTLELAETAGSGVDRMYAEMARVGHKPPTYLATESKVEVSLAGGAPNAALTRYVATLPTEEANDADTLLIILTLLDRRVVSAGDLMPILQKPTVEEAQSVLARIASDYLGILEPTRETHRRALPNYRLREEAITALGSAVSYSRRTQDQLDRKIIEMVRVANEINGRMVKVLFDVDTVAASRLLRDLVNREILKKAKGPERGPGVKYVRGPRFPRG